MKIFTKKRLLIVSLLLIASCGTPSRYSMKKDAYPDETIDVSTIQDAVPKKVVRTKAGNKSPYTVLGKTYYVMQSSTGFKQKGNASWYGKKFHGHKTSNGEVYNMYAMTAAHKTLPIPTYVRVTNVANGLSTVVRVNDRGPFHHGRIIDLSYAAARKLDYAHKGTARVEIEVLEPGEKYQVAEVAKKTTPLASADKVEPSIVSSEPNQTTTEIKIESNNIDSNTNDDPNYHLPANTFIQIAAYSSKNSANKLQMQMEELTGFPVLVRKTEQPGLVLYKVRVGPITDNFDLLRLRQLLKNRGFGNSRVVYD